MFPITPHDDRCSLFTWSKTFHHTASFIQTTSSNTALPWFQSTEKTFCFCISKHDNDDEITFQLIEASWAPSISEASPAIQCWWRGAIPGSRWFLTRTHNGKTCQQKRLARAHNLLRIIVKRHFHPQIAIYESDCYIDNLKKYRSKMQYSPQIRLCDCRFQLWNGWTCRDPWNCVIDFPFSSLNLELFADWRANILA